MYPYASYNDCCIVHSTSTRADPELVGGGGGWSCMLLLHPAPTCAELVLTFAPCTLTFAPCPYDGCHRHQFMVAVFLPQQLAQNTPRAHMVVSPIVTCAGGVFPSTHWRRYRTCARVTNIYSASCNILL